MNSFERVRQWIENYLKDRHHFDGGRDGPEQEHVNLEKDIKEAKNWQGIMDALDNYGISYWTHKAAADMWEQMIKELLLEEIA